MAASRWRIFHDLTVADNLTVGGYLLPVDQAQQREEEVLALFPRLRERALQRACSLSGGEQQMLAIGPAHEVSQHADLAKLLLS